MNDRKELCRLLVHRKTWGFSQHALAKLIGRVDRSWISRIESGNASPNLRIAFACQVLFGDSLAIMFPHIYGSIEDETMRNIAALHQQLLSASDPIAVRKREFLERALHRAINRPPAKGI